MSRAQKKLIQTILSLKTEQEAFNFLQGILTPKEFEEIPTRLQIVALLKQGVSQHAIAAKLGVGVATVSRGARELRLGRFSNLSNWA